MTATRPGLSHWLLFVLLTVTWGSAYLGIRIGLEDLPPLTLSAWRLLFAVIVLAVAFRLARASLPRDRRVYAQLAVLAVVNMALPFSLITWAELYIDSSLAAILMATGPLLTVVLASIFLDDESITPRRILGLVLGFTGVLILFGRAFGSGGSLIGELAILGSSLSYATGTVFVRRNLHGMHFTVPALFQIGFGLILISVLALVFESPFQFPSDIRTLVVALYLGCMSSAFGYLIYFHIVHVLGATRVSATSYVTPVVAIVLGSVVLGEVIELRSILGAAVILLGVGFVSHHDRPATSAPDRPTLG